MSKKKVYSEGEFVAMFIFGIVLGGCVLLLFLGAGGFFDHLERLHIDKDALAKDYIIEFYPEFKDCNVD